MDFSKVYDIKFNDLVIHFLPFPLRKIKMIAWLRSLVKPISNLHTQFINYRRAAIYKIEHTPQVFSLEIVLNDTFDIQQRRIYISDGAYRDGIYFYNPEEQKPVYFYDPIENAPVHFFDGAELFSLDTDFVVVVPFELNDAQEIRMRSLIDFYRLPDKTYNISIE
ncbi:hypothetical protein ML462_14130 [Gramella lutea]|uniref:Uncharacterized protein n=1 Tax=Christiangramia lutea TaxID=1607951 RepID=A0A9X1V4V8_9FLAO|nr:hypothetical protein [Christiangramia lutea]MCH4824310.1 hypothetical protein [Christiangramia lutea]